MKHILPWIQKTYVFFQALLSIKISCLRVFGTMSFKKASRCRDMILCLVRAEVIDMTFPYRCQDTGQCRRQRKIGQSNL